MRETRMTLAGGALHMPHTRRDFQLRIPVGRERCSRSPKSAHPACLKSMGDLIVPEPTERTATPQSMETEWRPVATCTGPTEQCKCLPLGGLESIARPTAAD